MGQPGDLGAGIPVLGQHPGDIRRRGSCSTVASSGDNSSGSLDPQIEVRPALDHSMQRFRCAEPPRPHGTTLTAPSVISVRVPTGEAVLRIRRHIMCQVFGAGFGMSHSPGCRMAATAHAGRVPRL